MNLILSSRIFSDGVKFYDRTDVMTAQACCLLLFYTLVIYESPKIIDRIIIFMTKERYF